MFKDGDSTIALCSLLQCLTTFTRRKFFLVSKLSSLAATWDLCFFVLFPWTATPTPSVIHRDPSAASFIAPTIAGNSTNTSACKQWQLKLPACDAGISSVINKGKILTWMFSKLKDDGSYFTTRVCGYNFLMYSS